MNGSASITLTIFAFFFTVFLILWRPRAMNEAVPATGGALLVLMSGTVSMSDLGRISTTVSGAAITIMATIVMAIVLESFGFFVWAAEGLAYRAKGSGVRLFWYVNLTCFLMTMFFNNDGSILITTPILLLMLQRFCLKNHEKIPYLLSGALVATASSAPIGVSNIVNLIALKIVGMDLYTQAAMMFLPAMLGLLLLVFLLFLCFRRTIPTRIPLKMTSFPRPGSSPFSHPLKPKETSPIPSPHPAPEGNRFMAGILLFVLVVRLSLFLASYLEIPIEWVAVAGSCLLLVWRWIHLGIPPTDMARKIPWHILVFAFGMYVIIYGLNNIGLTDALIRLLKPLVEGDLLNASLLMGGLLTFMSILVNNHPALMIGTITLTDMGLDPLTLKVAYLASVIGSDIGSLILPAGTLASLIWIHILRQHKVKISWSEYVKVTFIVIPPTMLFTLTLLAYWVHWLYGG